MQAQPITLQTSTLCFAGLAYGDPTCEKKVLALHGWLDNAASFSRLLPLLNDVYVVALDLPGHGYSEHYGKGQLYDNFTYVCRILDAIHALGWQRFSILGHSLGTVIFTLLASAIPERVNSVVFLDGLGPLHEAVHQGAARCAASLAAYEDFFLVDEQTTTAESVVKRQYKAYKSLDAMIKVRMRANGLTQDAALPLVERAAYEKDGKYYWRFDTRLLLPSFYRLSHEQVLSYLSAIQSPFCLIRAKDSFLKNYPGFEARMDVISQLQYHELPGEHHFHLQTPEPIADIMNTFFCL